MLTVLAFSADYRVVRLMSFRDPWADPYDTGFQLTQALMAIGRGEWGGVGLGESVQKLFYLPEAHTDFVFAVLVEELGFAGATLVIALFGVVVYRAITLGREAMRSGMHFQGLVATGIGVMLGFEAFVNIGVNSGLLPTKGLPLPLISYGRASTVVTLVALGFLLRIHHELHGGQKRLVQRGLRAMSARPDHDHGGRHGRARVPGARRRGRAQGAAARRRLARHAARARGAARAAARHRHRVDHDRRRARPRALGVVVGAVSDRRGGRCRRSARCAAGGPRPCSAWADSSRAPAASPRGSRAGRCSFTSRTRSPARRIAGSRRSPRECFEAFPGSFPARARAEVVGNPVRRSMMPAEPPRAAVCSRAAARAAACS